MIRFKLYGRKVKNPFIANTELIEKVELKITSCSRSHELPLLCAIVYNTRHFTMNLNILYETNLIALRDFMKNTYNNGISMYFVFKFRNFTLVKYENEIQLYNIHLI